MSAPDDLLQNCRCVEILPLVPYDMGGWNAFLPPQHPFVRDTPAGIACQKEWDRINKANRSYP